ncbi:hypothetical protein LPTSP4_19050 [Leptospira ryugenii]|uniref:Uncharacterized protein n=1 Tax=Leptospira ryugenii TaxID=1917863 RepID=A0A2P2E0H0_9LEPT|nr:hypothetical protein [Leptospira ryugenii]GBF50380.1 hypothetical protein LPTSP4_19050 [Leptospira ryugenii]
MKQSALSILVFGVYMLGQGVILFFAPNFLLGLFGIPETNEFWVKVVAIALLILSYYYIRAASLDVQTFFQLSTEGRTIQFVLFTILVFAMDAPKILIALSFFELLSALWTFLALKKEKLA